MVGYGDPQLLELGVTNMTEKRKRTIPTSEKKKSNLTPRRKFPSRQWRKPILPQKEAKKEEV